MSSNDYRITVFDDEAEPTISTGTNQSTGNNVNPSDNVIAEDVIAVIAAQAALNVDSVFSMDSTAIGDIAEAFGVINPTKGVSIRMDEDRVIIDLYVIVRFGQKIPDIAWQIQENVKKDVEDMTGAIVQSVNVHVCGVDFSQPVPKTKIGGDNP